MDTERIQAHVDALRAALKSGDEASGLEHQARLTEAAAWALLNQDADAMQTLCVHFEDLASLADHYGWGGPGQRWLALDEVMYCCEQTYRPLEQLRLAHPGRLSGEIIETIAKSPGITPKKIAKVLDKEPNHISNELKRLEQEGLIIKIPAGRNIHLHIARDEFNLPTQLGYLRKLLEIFDIEKESSKTDYNTKQQNNTASAIGSTKLKIRNDSERIRSTHWQALHSRGESENRLNSTAN